MKPEAFENAIDYMKIICLGTVFVFGYNAICSIMKGLGDSKSSLYFVMIATLINVLLDIILVGLGQLGTKGAAYATVFSQGVSLIISIMHLKRKQFGIDFKLKSFIFKKTQVISILKIGLPTALQMVTVNISYLLVTSMLNQFGVTVAAALA